MIRVVLFYEQGLVQIMDLPYDTPPDYFDFRNEKDIEITQFLFKLEGLFAKYSHVYKYRETHAEEDFLDFRSIDPGPETDPPQPPKGSA